MNYEVNEIGMTEHGERPTGLTKDVGFQIGVRRTLPVKIEDIWQFLTSREGLNIWLGKADNLDFYKSGKYQLADGTIGEVRVFSPISHLRITYHPPGWSRPSTIQVRVIPKEEKTVIAFHQEHLPGPNEREERRIFFVEVLDKLEHIFSRLKP